MTECSQCEGALTADAPAILHDRVEYRFCSIHCMIDWLIDLEYISPLPPGTNRTYWRVLDLSEAP